MNEIFYKPFLQKFNSIEPPSLDSIKNIEDLKIKDFDQNSNQNSNQDSFPTESSPITGYVPEFSFRQSTPGKIISNNINIGKMQEVLNKFKEAGINIRVTSGLRPNARTKNGSLSWHSQGEALDIVPIEGESFTDLANNIRNNPQLVQWLSDNGYGILDETSDAMLRRTGGTGKHFHIGRDKIALAGLQNFRMKNGGVFNIPSTIKLGYERQFEDFFK